MVVGFVKGDKILLEIYLSKGSVCFLHISTHPVEEKKNDNDLKKNQIR
jgi:hypothetical protein